MKLPQYRNPPDLIDRMPDTSWFTHAQIFDDVLIVANVSTASFILKTTEGLIVIDAIYPKVEMYNAIIDGIRDIGWDPKDIKKLVITHGHFDHCGCGRWIVDNFHPETYLSKIDDDFWRDCPFYPDRPETWKNFDIDHYVDDGDEITLGNTTIKVFFTPGHTPGGLSFVFPVHDNGVLHMAGMWGGTNPPGSIKEIVTYFQSLDHFLEETEKLHCDVTINNHPTMDGYDKIAYARHRTSHMPNIYIIGEDGFRHFCQLYRYLCYDKLLGLAQEQQA